MDCLFPLNQYITINQFSIMCGFPFHSTKTPGYWRRQTIMNISY